MNLPVLLCPEAETDVRNIHTDLESVRHGLGRRFAFQLRMELERIEQQPELRAKIWMDVRAARVKKFQYIVYYVVFADYVDVLAIMHGARDKSAWHRRLGRD